MKEEYGKGVIANQVRNRSERIKNIESKKKVRKSYDRKKKAITFAPLFAERRKRDREIEIK